MFNSGVLILFIGSIFNYSSSVSDSLSVDSVISNTESAYRNTKQYLDSGKVLLSFYNTKYPNTIAKCFKTAYSKSGLFNFEFHQIGQSNSLYVINRDQDKRTKSWWGINNLVKTHDSLDEALLAAKGVSNLTSTLIPELLFTLNEPLGVSTPTSTILPPVISPRKGSSESNFFKSMTSLSLLESEEVNQIQCFKVKGIYKTGTAIVWISKRDLLIRRIDIDMNVKDFKVHSVYSFYPYTANDKELFKFRPNREIKL